MSFLAMGLRSAVMGCLLLSCVLTAPHAAFAKKLTTLRVIVLDEQGAPVSRASVVLSRLSNSKKKIKVKGEALQLRTSQQGTAPLPPLAQGRYMLQIISEGYQTHGAEILLDQSEQSVTVTMKPPQKQFSVHVGK